MIEQHTFIKQCYITLKGHKNRFNSKMQLRLKNPTSLEIGVISKIIIDNINKQVRRGKGFNERINNDEVLSWFRNLKNDNINFSNLTSSIFLLVSVKAFQKSH